MANEKTKNLGQVAAIWISPNAPDNVRLIWYDTILRKHKVYDTINQDWIALNPQVVTNTDIATLKAHISGDEHGYLSIGDFYYLTDVGTLAIAITTTKIWYVDALNNYVVNDLAATITAYINSDNLLIDGSTGVWNNTTGRLEFNFSEVATGESLQNDNDYIVIRRKNNTVWSWVKAKLSGFISAVSGNSISWNKGFYFNFTTAINVIKNKAGGIVGYDEYQSDLTRIDTNIENISYNKEDAIQEAKKYTDQEVSSEKIYNKKRSRSGDVTFNIAGKSEDADRDSGISYVFGPSDSYFTIHDSYIRIDRGATINFSSLRPYITQVSIAFKTAGAHPISSNNLYIDAGGGTLNVPTDGTDVKWEGSTQSLRIVNDATNGSELEITKFVVQYDYSIEWNILDNPPDVPNVNATLNDILQVLISWANVLQRSEKIKIGSGFLPNGRSGNVNYSDTVRAAIEKLVYQTKNQATTLNEKQRWITWRDENGNEVNKVIRFTGGFSFQPIVGEENLYEAIIPYREYINEDTWHTGTNVLWIIRNNVLFLNLQHFEHTIPITSEIATHASTLEIDLGPDFQQYIHTVFEHMPWTYQDVSYYMHVFTNYKEKFIAITPIASGTLGLCISCTTTTTDTTTDSVDVFDAKLGYMHGYAPTEEINVTIHITDRIIAIPLSF